MAATNHSVGIAHLTVVPRNAAVTGEDEEDGGAEVDAKPADAESEAEPGDPEADAKHGDADDAERDA